MFEANSQTWTIPIRITVSPGVPTAETGQSTMVKGGGNQRSHSEFAEGLFGGPSKPVFPGASKKFLRSDLENENFSWQNALNTSLCSSLAYETVSTVRRTAVENWKFDDCQFISTENTECFVASSSQAIVVSFRGTQQTSDWLINLNIATKSTNYGWVHRGFYFALHSVKNQVERALDHFDAQQKKVILTGHSLGGAVATIGAAEWFGKYPISGIYTFGQPAVGFSTLRSSIEVIYPQKFYRFVNDDDIVPQVPPGYRHVGKLYHFDAQGDMRHESFRTVSPVAEDTPTMSRRQFMELQTRLKSARETSVRSNERLERSLTQEGLFPSISDHNINRYIEKILDKLD